MMIDFRRRIAGWISPEREKELTREIASIDLRVNQRVADVLVKMDPFEPLLKKYNIIFSEEYEKLEEKLDENSQFRLFIWAYGVRDDPSFKYLVNWVRNTQGNATVRKSSADHQWFFGRAMIASITLIVEEVSRLASRYEDIITKKDRGFDKHLPVED